MIESKLKIKIWECTKKYIRPWKSGKMSKKWYDILCIFKKFFLKTKFSWKIIGYSFIVSYFKNKSNFQKLWKHILNTNSLRLQRLLTLRCPKFYQGCPLYYDYYGYRYYGYEHLVEISETWLQNFRKMVAQLKLHLEAFPPLRLITKT